MPDMIKNKEREDLGDKLNQEAEKQANASQPQESELEKKTNKGFFGTLREFTLGDWAKVAGYNILGAAFGGGLLNVATTSFSYVLAHYFGNRKKLEKDGLKKEFYLGGIITPGLYHFYKGLNNVSGFFGRTMAWFGIVPFFNLAFLPIRYMVHNYTPKKILKEIFNLEILKLPYDLYTKSIKGKLLKATKETWKWLTLPMALALNFVPFKYQIASTAVSRTGYKYITERSIGGNTNSNSAEKKAEYKPKTELARQPGYQPAHA